LLRILHLEERIETDAAFSVHVETWDLLMAMEDEVKSKIQEVAESERIL